MNRLPIVGTGPPVYEHTPHGAGICLRRLIVVPPPRGPSHCSLIFIHTGSMRQWRGGGCSARQPLWHVLPASPVPHSSPWKAEARGHNPPEAVEVAPLPVVPGPSLGRGHDALPGGTAMGFQGGLAACAATAGAGMRRQLQVVAQGPVHELKGTEAGQ